MIKLFEKISITYLMIATVLILPLIFLCGIAGIISFFWLLSAGQWKAIVAGAIFAVIMPFVVGIVSLPAVPAALIMMFFNSKKRGFLLVVLAFIVSIYSSCCIAAWVYFVFTFLVNNSVSKNLLTPILFW